MSRSTKMKWVLVTLLLGTGIARANREVEMQIEWGRNPGRLAALKVLADPVANVCETAYAEGFASGWGDWYTDHGVWEIGPSSSVPPSPVGGGNCAGTVLNGNHPGDTDSRLISPVLTLPTVAGDTQLELRFWQWYAYSRDDMGYVQIRVWDGSRWGSWVTLATPTAASTNSHWSPVAASLTEYAGKVIQIAFYHTADSYWGGTGLGWYIDEVRICQGAPVFLNPETFELEWGDWSTDRGVWEIGVPASGPDAAYDGQAVAATVLSGNHPGDTDSRLISPMVTLPAVAGDEELELRYRQWYSYGRDDAGYVQIRVRDEYEWGDWVTVATPTAPSTNSNWCPVAARLTEYAGQTVQIAFYHTADSYWGGTNVGWYIDEVTIRKGVPVFLNPETFASGWRDWHTDRGVWEIGVSSLVPPSPVVGGNCAGTVLNGNYPPDTDSRLISPPVVLPVSPALQLRFWQWYSYGRDDVGSVEISTWDGVQWSNWRALSTTTASSTSSGWSLVAVSELAEYGGERVRIAFHHRADSYWGGDGRGWYIDDVEIRGLVQPLVLSAWSLSEDSGVSSSDKLTNDATPALSFVFSRPAYGTDGDIRIVDPDGIEVTPDLVTGWGTDSVTVVFTTPLATEGQYAVTLKGTIRDAQGTSLGGGVDQIVQFTLDTEPPLVTADPLTTGDTMPRLTGTVDDPDAKVEVTVDGWDSRNYPAVNNRNGTWTLPDDTISPALTPGIHQVVVFATDRAGNVAFDIGLDGLNVTGLRISCRQMKDDGPQGQSRLDVFVTNNASTPVTGTLWLVVKEISEPSVTLANPDATTPEGDPLLDLTPLLGDGRLDQDETVGVLLTFDNPQQVQFSATIAVRTVP